MGVKSLFDRWIRQAVLGVAAGGLLAGCASHAPSPSAKGASSPTTTPAPLASASAAPVTQPTTSVTASSGAVGATTPARDTVAEAKARLSLDHVPPTPRLRAPLNSTSVPPVAALDLYAQARVAELDKQRYTAINLIEKAIALDPESWELRFTLAKLYQGTNSFDDRSIAALVAADTLDPDHLPLQTSLGRQLLAKGETSTATEHLLLALQTRQYSRDGAGAAVADFFLGSALRQQGYDRAALTVFERLQIRLRNAGYEIRATPELSLLAAHPEVVALQVGELQQRCGHYADALANLQVAVASDSRNWDLQSRIVRVLLALHRPDEAADRAAEMVVREHASADSVALLKEVFKALGRESDVSNELGRLYQSHPNAHALLYAQLDTLRAQGRLDDADHALRDASQKHPDDFELFKRRFNLLTARDDRAGAAAMLCTAIAHKSDWAGEGVAMLSDLMLPTTHGRLTLTKLKNLQVPPSAMVVKNYFLALAGYTWHHQDVSDDALARALAARPVFAPAWREKLERVWAQTDLDDSQKAQAGQTLVDAAASVDASGLSSELAGLNLLQQKQIAPGIEKLNAAIKQGDNGPDPLIALASAQRDAGDEGSFESTLWKTVSDWPMCRDAYLELYGLYNSRNSSAQADRVLLNWLSSDPNSVLAQRIQARDYYRAGRKEAAEGILLRMFNERGDNPEVLAAVMSLYTETNRLDDYTTSLRERVARDPGNFAAATQFADLMVTRHESDSALKALDALRRASADDADVLYNLSGFYGRFNFKAQSEQTLRDVLKADPSHPGASNDLGYELAESGKDLSNAEVLVRRAVLAEPHNASFLDSLGWVLYKRGRFSEAQKYLLEAVGPFDQVDPVVLNHLGDTLYRLGDAPGAMRVWKRASDRLDSGHGSDADDADEEGRTLKSALQQKSGEVDAGKPASVAPVVDSAVSAASQPVK